MILKGSQRGGARQLSAHLLKEENEQIELMELRGFMADDLPGAFDEAHAIAHGTKCKQFLFSISLNPPADAVLSDADFQKSADEVEARLGIKGQPRIIVVHEKEGRRHAHAVWSRIDAQTMTAKPLPFFKNRLRDLSREMYLEHGWTLPDGLRDPLLKNPRNFDQAEWQQAQRTERDPREIKQVFAEAWQQSDGRKAFAAALEERGFILAKGDRRGYVAVDHHGEVYSLSRWSGVKTKDIRARIGNPDDLPGVEAAKERMRAALSPKLKGFRQELVQAHRAKIITVKERKFTIAVAHRTDRDKLKAAHELRRETETHARASQFRSGVAGLWDRISGRARTTREHNALAAQQCERRDQSEMHALVSRQLAERQLFQKEVVALRTRQRDERLNLDADIGAALVMEGRKHANAARIRLLLERSRNRNGPTLDR